MRSQRHEAHPKLAEAHKMLSEVRNWFTEEFDTADLQDAKRLLEELEYSGGSFGLVGRKVS